MVFSYATLNECRFMQCVLNIHELVIALFDCHFIQSHIRRVRACLAVTYYLHFWQNDRDLLHAAEVGVE